MRYWWVNDWSMHTRARVMCKVKEKIYFNLRKCWTDPKGEQRMIRTSHHYPPTWSHRLEVVWTPRGGWWLAHKPILHVFRNSQSTAVVQGVCCDCKLHHTLNPACVRDSSAVDAKSVTSFLMAYSSLMRQPLPSVLLHCAVPVTRRVGAGARDRAYSMWESTAPM